MKQSRFAVAIGVAALLGPAACRRQAAPGPPRATGYVEATDVRVASRVPGRVERVDVTEGATVTAGQTMAQIATTDADLALQRARAERAQADAQVRLLRAGARSEDIQQAQAQLNAAAAEQRAADADLESARADEARFEQLLRSKAGSQKQRDDAVTRRLQAEARVKAAADRTAAGAAGLARLKAGSRPEEIDAAVARMAAIDAQIASIERDRRETTVVSPLGGIVASRLVEPGELVAAGTPLMLVIDLDHAWVNAYVEAPIVPGLRIEQAATVVTDAGDRLPGTIAFISPKAEFTPRNVQTTTERAKLVYRVKVAVDNSKGVLKPGMAVDVLFAGQER